MKAKEVAICFCMDVTLEDILKAIELGYRDIESIKRFTGVGTGPCQGRMCLPIVAEILREKTGWSGELPTQRPPVKPVPLVALAEVGEDER
ncbi:MAG: (2Fe-2S)-binding protein [Thermoproteota archaeon]|nr:MAG: (2Fe-2S)-binding protein [Candidatus Korarchaeota archaeon]RLG55065.1 MAG: (2Fe-2S)-binding protein [Candidatus Korarchaeota archaeon]